MSFEASTVTSRVSPQGTSRRKLPSRFQRRSNKLPKALAIVGVSLLTLTGLDAVQGIASASPDYVPPGPFFSVPSMWVNATSVTINFTAGCSGYSPINIEWGNTTNATAFSQQVDYSSSTLTGSIYLNYLEPATAYDFTLLVGSGAGGECIINGHGYPFTGYYNGNFSTKSDSITTISGTVKDTSGSPARAGTVVAAYCVADAAYLDGPYYFGADHGILKTVTNSTGVYSLPSWPLPDDETNPCYATGEPPIVTVQNYPESIPGTNTYVWPGQWNETVALFAPQVVDFVLPANFISDPAVEVADFSNANTSNGFPDDTMGYTNTVYYNDTASSCANIYGWEFDCTSSSYSSVATSNYTVTGSNLIVTQTYWVSGTVVYDALSRQANVSAFDYYQTDGSPVLEPASYTIPYEINPSTTGAYPLYYWGGTGSGGGVMALANRPVNGSITINATHTANWSTGWEWSGEIPVGELIGVPVGLPLSFGDYSFAERSLTNITSFSWKLYGDSSTVPVCYAVYGIGGATNSYSTTADAIGIWAYNPTDESGVYTCPLPS